MASDQGPGVVTLEQMKLLFEGRDPYVLDFTQQHEDGNQPTFRVKEGAVYHIQLVFRIAGEIVSGLRYHHVTKYKNVKATKSTQMVGSFGPQDTPQEITLSVEYEAPKGMMYRGNYEFSSKFLTEAALPIKQWDWTMLVEKDWE